MKTVQVGVSFDTMNITVAIICISVTITDTLASVLVLL